MKPKLNRTFKISFAIGLSFTTIGLILMLSGLTNLGAAFFFFLPLAIGLSSGILPEPRQAVKGTLVSLAVFSLFLLFTQIEGLICVIMALPIILAAIGLGWFVGQLIRRYSGNDSPNLKSSLAPLLLFVVANFFEVFSGSTMIPASVSMTVALKASPPKVYNAIIAVDTVDVETNFLQKLGLPIPRKCILTEEKVGGLRICVFEEGRIVETIKELRKNELLRMDVTEWKLDRERHWLRFNEDIYALRPMDDGGTEVTRTTTYFSNLKPRVYWELMEALTIKSEQEFVFRNLVKDVSE